MKILAISGSTREESTNTALLKAISEIAPKSIEIRVFHDLNLLPIFSPDDEGEKTPAVVRNFIELIDTSDGVIISSPEYVRSIPGGLKNAIDWMVSRIEIIDKPIALVHASSRGDDMLDSLKRVLSTVSSNFFQDLLFRISLIGKSPEEIIELMHSMKYESQITLFLTHYIEEIKKCSLA